MAGLGRRVLIHGRDCGGSREGEPWGPGSLQGHGNGAAAVGGGDKGRSSRGRQVHGVTWSEQLATHSRRTLPGGNASVGGDVQLDTTAVRYSRATDRLGIEQSIGLVCCWDLEGHTSDGTPFHAGRGR